jgi:hypothetical protein
MADGRQRPLTRGDVFPIINAHVGPIAGYAEYTAAGVVVFVPAAAPRPDGLDGARAELEADGPR